MTEVGIRQRTSVQERSGGTVVVTSMASDSHTWNLVFLQLLIEEIGYDVVNLGPCVPDDLLVRQCREISPEMIVISSVNGHGYQDGMRVIGQLRDCPELSATPMVIGGKLGITHGEGGSFVGELKAAGFDAVFEDSADPITDFTRFMGALTGQGSAIAGPVRVLA